LLLALNKTLTQAHRGATTALPIGNYTGRARRFLAAKNNELHSKAAQATKGIFCLASWRSLGPLL
jgi:hypothetical protein